MPVSGHFLEFPHAVNDLPKFRIMRPRFLDLLHFADNFRLREAVPGIGAIRIPGFSVICEGEAILREAEMTDCLVGKRSGIHRVYFDRLIQMQKGLFVFSQIHTRDGNIVVVVFNRGIVLDCQLEKMIRIRIIFFGEMLHAGEIVFVRFRRIELNLGERNSRQGGQLHDENKQYIAFQYF